MSTADQDNQSRQGYAAVNGLNLYHEIHGSGEPLVLLPGGFMTIEAMGEIVPRLATARRVISVERQGHGHTADIERVPHYEWMADDIAALIGHLGLEQADIFGYSLGGVGLQTASRQALQSAARVQSPGWAKPSRPAGA